MSELPGLPALPALRRPAAAGSLLAGPASKAEVLADSDMAALVSGHDWAATPLGPAQDWPQSLKGAVRLMLGSRYPMFVWWGPKLAAIYNDAYAEIIGSRHPWALGRSARETWAELWDVVGPQVEHVLQRGGATWNDRLLLVIHSDGIAEETYFTFSYSPCFDDNGEVGGVYCVCTDETRRVLGERRLKTLGALSAAVMDSHNPGEACENAARSLAGNAHDLPFVLFYLQDGDTARLVARAGVDDTRIAPPEIDLAAPAGPWPLATVAEHRQPMVVSGLADQARVPAGPWPEPVQDAIVLPLPASVPGAPGGFMVAGLNPRRPLDAEYREWLGLVAQQVTSALADARSFEEQQQRARSLAELDQAKTEFFSHVSHELRTPLALVLAPIADLLEADSTGAPARDALKLAQRNGHRLQRLVDALLEFSRIEGGRVQAHFRPIDLAAHTAGLAAFFQSAATRAGLSLQIDCEPLPRPVYVDRSLWEKIVFNLVSNAIKYTLAGQVVVSLRAAPGGARLEVADTGVGIPEHSLPRVFERFYRVEGLQGRSVDGCGVGLALVAQLARLHGGTAQAHSRLGEGSTFSVELPWGSDHLPAGQLEHLLPTTVPPPEPPFGWLEEVESWIDSAPAGLPGEAADAPAAAAAPTARGAGLGLVLVAEDNADMRGYLTQLIGREHEVQAVSDGWQALQAIAGRMPDLVVTDTMMPGLDGFGLLQRLRAEPATAGLPVVMLSADAGHHARLRAVEAGADDFLVKPFHARELLARLTATLRLAQVRREAMQLEQALRAELQDVLESVTDGFIAVDAQWRFSYVNSAAEAIYGRSRESMLGRSYWELFPGAAGSVFEQPMRLAMSERAAVTVDGPYDPLAGWFEVSIYPLASGGLALSFRDVLQTRLLERSIRESEAQQRFLADFGGLMQRIDDPEAVLDAAMQALAGHLQADRCCWVLFDEDEDSLEIHGEFRRDGMPPGLGRVRLRDFGGEQLRLYRAGQPFVVHDVETDPRVESQREAFRRMRASANLSCGILRAGRLVAGVAVQQSTARRWSESEIALLQAATQRCWEAFERAQVQRRQREAAEALAQALAALQQVERRKDQFIATLAHELRNPLAPLRNGVQLLELGGGADGGARVQAMMRRQIDHLVRLVDDLLEVSRITSGKVVLQRDRLSLQEVLAGAAEANRPVLEAARHSLHVDIDCIAGLQVDGDPLRLGQVFANLLNNAAKYTDPGGHVALTAWSEGSQAVVQVQDNGMGLPPGMLEEVFQPFVQADRSASRAQGGLGIGLSIVRSLVELHGGVVCAKSDGPGQGATFEVRLPVELPQDAPPASPAEQVSTPASEGHGPTVLVVDDNRDAADSLGAMLEMMGASPRVVYGGTDALAAAQAQAPQLVLLDLGMPGMDGYEVVRRLAAHPQRSHMHVVALTGWGQAEDRQRTRDAGFDEHMVKPAEISALQELLGRVAGLPA